MTVDSIATSNTWFIEFDVCILKALHYTVLNFRELKHSNKIQQSTPQSSGSRAPNRQLSSVNVLPCRDKWTGFTSRTQLKAAFTPLNPSAGLWYGNCNSAPTTASGLHPEMQWSFCTECCKLLWGHSHCPKCFTRSFPMIPACWDRLSGLF